MQVRSTNKKFFGAAVFQKCCRGVGEQPTFAKQIKLHNEEKQKSKRKLKESQLPFESGGCNEIQGFRGNCDSQGKLGMCPSLAEPDWNGFPKTSRRYVPALPNHAQMVFQIIEEINCFFAKLQLLKCKQWISGYFQE